MQPVQTSTLNRVVKEINNIVNNHYFKPDFGYGPTSDINAGNQLTMPFVWVEPFQSKLSNSVQGLKAQKLTLNVYAMDRIDKGDSNFQEIHSNMLMLLENIATQFRESQTYIELFIRLEKQDMVFEPVTRDTDENCNGWRARMEFRIPMTYTPCTNPINQINDVN